MGDTGMGGPRTYCEAFQRTAATNPDANRIEFYRSTSARNISALQHSRCTTRSPQGNWDMS
jgi:hypothetical protein